MNKRLKKSAICALTLLALLLSNVEFVCCAAANQGEIYIKHAETAKSEDEKNSYLQKAADFYEEKYEKSNNNIELAAKLGKIYCLLDSKSDARRVLMQAYSTYGDNPKIQAEVAGMYFYFQEYNTALEFYKLALSSGHLTNVQTNISTAKCYEKLADLDNAKLYYKIALKLNPNNKEAKSGLHKLGISSTSVVQQHKEFLQPKPKPDYEGDTYIETIIDETNAIQ